jgi:hypothetical protein
MPHLPPSAQLWKERAEIDHIGPFVKAWAAFNAWYRHASQAAKEAEMLAYVKTNPNPVRARVLPMLGNQNAGPNEFGEGGEGKAFKQSICDLQLALDAFQFEVTKNGNQERVTLRSVCISPKHLNQEVFNKNNHDYRIARIQGGGGRIEVTVTSTATQAVKFRHEQDQYDRNELFAQPGYVALSQAQRSTLQTFYFGADPRPMIDLTAGNGPELMIGTIPFNCTAEQLFFGLIEVIYAMRNALLHGELQPDKQVLACYDPAYRIMHFLNCLHD